MTSRRLVAAIVTVCVMITGTVVLSDASASDSAANATSVVGSFAVGAGTGAIDERSGAFTFEVPVAALPGVAGSSVSLVVTYSHADVATDRVGLGAGWDWSGPHIDVQNSAGIRVRAASGGMYEPDSSLPSGLGNYPKEDIVFRQESNVLPERPGAPSTPYTYVLTQLGGTTDYFNAAGDRVAQTDMFGNRIDYLWGEAHTLLGVIDDGGNRIDIIPTDTGFTVIAPSVNSSEPGTTRIRVRDGHLDRITNPVDEHVAFRYETDTRVANLLAGITSDSGLATTVTYQTLPDRSNAVEHVTLKDAGQPVSTITWGLVGEHSASGYPDYTNSAELWGSGDGAYRYVTLLSDGTTTTRSEYNAMGVLVRRALETSTTAGNRVTVQEQTFSYAGTAEGGVPHPHAVPAHYGQPLTVTVTHKDGNNGSRSVRDIREYDSHGRVVKNTTPDGATTTTVFHDAVPTGQTLSAGFMREQTTTGSDGSTVRVHNTLSADAKSIARSETFAGSAPGDLVLTHISEYTVDETGFVREERTIALAAKESHPSETRVTHKRTVAEKTVTLTHTHATGTPDSVTTSTQRDKGTGLVLSQTDAVGRSSSFSYDRMGRVAQKRDAAGRTTLTEYDNRTTRVSAPDGVTTWTTTDALGRVVAMGDNVKNGVAVPGFQRIAQTHRYENNGSVVFTRDAHGIETRTVSDLAGRTIEVRGPVITAFAEHDDVANTSRTGIASRDAHELHHSPVITTTERDDTGKPVKQTAARADGMRVPDEETSYDGLGRVRERLSSDVATSVTFNPDGTPAVTSSVPQSVEFPGKPFISTRQFSSLWGESTQKTLHQDGSESRNGGARTFNALGRVVSETDQEGKTTLYTYTPDGLIHESRNLATGAITVNIFDPLTRALARTETQVPEAGAVVTEYDYDPATGRVTAMWNSIDLSNTRLSYTYDAWGNMTSIRYPDGKTVTHVYDEHSRKTATVDVAGNTTRFEIGDTGLPSRVIQTTSEGMLIAGVTYTYDELGRTETIQRDNGPTTTYTYTSAGDIATERTAHGDAVIFEGRYDYDTHGNVARATTKQSEHSGTDTAVATTRTFSYDAFDRLTASHIFDGEHAEGDPRETNTYVFNVSGDITDHTHTRDGAITARSFEYNQLGHLVAVTSNGERETQEYDRHGNLTRDARGTRFSYDALNRLAAEAHPDGRVVESSYWADGRRKTMASRVTSNSPALLTTTYWDEAAAVINETHEAAGADAETSSYLLGTTRHARTVTDISGTSTTSSYVTDRHGNTVATTHEGVPSARYSYSDYGVASVSMAVASGAELITASISEQLRVAAHRNPFLYAGEYTTPTGSIVLGRRMYNPGVMRFTTRDTAPLHNRYAYANGNPITMVDPSGETSIHDAFTQGAIASVFALGAALNFFGALRASLGVASIGFAMAAGVDTAVASVQAADTMTEHFSSNLKGTGIISDRVAEALGWASVALITTGPLAKGLLGKKAGAPFTTNAPVIASPRTRTTVATTTVSAPVSPQRVAARSVRDSVSDSDTIDLMGSLSPGARPSTAHSGRATPMDEDSRRSSWDSDQETTHNAEMKKGLATYYYRELPGDPDFDVMEALGTLEEYSRFLRLAVRVNGDPRTIGKYARRHVYPLYVTVMRQQSRVPLAYRAEFASRLRKVNTWQDEIDVKMRRKPAYAAQVEKFRLPEPEQAAAY